MFFRRVKPHIATFDECLKTMAGLGIKSSKKSDAKAAVMRDRCAAVIKTDGSSYAVDPIGIVVGNEIAVLVDGGNQKFWQAPSGKREPAQAEQLVALHAFAEDVRESLGLTSLYNEGLGSVNASHMYDRVKDRDHGPAHRPWEA